MVKVDLGSGMPKGSYAKRSSRHRLPRAVGAVWVFTALHRLCVWLAKLGEYRIYCGLRKALTRALLNMKDLVIHWDHWLWFFKDGPQAAHARLQKRYQDSDRETQAAPKAKKNTASPFFGQ